MSEFKFQKSQRVIVPAAHADAANVQGVVTGTMDQLGKGPKYFVQWPSVDTTDAFGTLNMMTRVIGEAELAEAQPAEKAGLALEVKVDQTYLDAALGKARELEGIVRRTAPKPKRKPARKSRRK